MRLLGYLLTGAVLSGTIFAVVGRGLGYPLDNGGDTLLRWTVLGTATVGALVALAIANHRD